MSLRFELCDLVWQVQWKYKKYNQSTFNYVLNNYVDVNELKYLIMLVDVNELKYLIMLVDVNELLLAE